MTYFDSAEEAVAGLTEIKGADLKVGDILVGFHSFERHDVSKPGWPLVKVWVTVETPVTKIEPSYYGKPDIREVWTPGALRGVTDTETLYVKR